MSKRTSLLFIVILTVSSLILVNLAPASITKPSVPEFTVKFEAHPYDVPPTYGIDPYTGKNVMTQAGYHVENKSIEVIKILKRNIKWTPLKNFPNGSLDYNFSFDDIMTDEKAQNTLERIKKEKLLEQVNIS